MFNAVVFCAAALLGADGRVDSEVCGRNALGLVAAWHKIQVPPGELDYLLPSERAPFSFADLERAAKALGFETHLGRWARPESARFDCPAILRVRAQPDSPQADHFIVSFGAAENEILAADFPGAPTRLSLERLKRIWTGEMLYVERRPAPIIGEMRAQRRWRIARWSAAAAIAAVAAAALFSVRRAKRNDDAATEAGRPMARLGRTPKLYGALAGVAALSACAFVVIRASNEKPALTTPLTASPELLVIEPKDSAETSRKVAFRLTNVGNRPLTIKHVTSSCSCMTVKSIDGAVLAPNESQNLEIDIALPRMGRTARSVRVHYDAAEEPLLLHVVLQGSRPLPFIARKINAEPIFAGVADAESPQTVVVETREKLGSPAWLGALTCELDGVQIAPLGIREAPDEKIDVTVRKYSWSVAWPKAPSANEVWGRLSVSTASESIFIGQIFARFADDMPFLPSAVHLEGGTKEREIIIARRGSARIWTIDESAELPDWLAISSTEIHDRQGFEVRLTDAAPRHGSGAAMIPLKSRDGAPWHLRISARFESNGAADR